VRVFLDANILFSAADPKSATRHLLVTLAASHEAVTSPHAWEEARRNLELKRPEHRKGLDDLREFASITGAFTPPPEMQLPESDIPIMAGAIGARCEYLWTSDRTHFGRYYGTRLGGVTVVSSIQLAEQLVDRRRGK